MGQIQTPGNTNGWIRCLGQVSIPCRPVTSTVNPISNAKISSENQFVQIRQMEQSIGEISVSSQETEKPVVKSSAIWGEWKNKQLKAGLHGLWKHQRSDQVPRSKHPLSTCHTRRDPYFQIRLTILTVVKISVWRTTWQLAWNKSYSMWPKGRLYW
jgi:hypothetical protein